MYLKSFSIMWQNPTWYGAFLVFQLAGSLMLEMGTGGWSASFVVTALIAFYTQLLALYGDEPFSTRSSPTGLPLTPDGRNVIKLLRPFILKAFVLVAVMVLLIALSVLVLERSGSGDSIVAISGIPGLLAAILAVLVFVPFVLSALGTWLPATIVGIGTTLKDAVRRTPRTFWKTYGRLLFGPILLQILTVAFAVFLHFVNPLWTPIVIDGHFNPLSVPALVVISILQLLIMTMTVVILTSAYLDSEGQPPSPSTV